MGRAESQFWGEYAMTRLTVSVVSRMSEGSHEQGELIRPRQVHSGIILNRLNSGSEAMSCRSY